ncbi:MAG: 40S ribosomal protein S19, partial [Candidatus Micrarchaeota archaeon]
IEKTAEKLKHVAEIKIPESVKYAKTGSHVERAPDSKDFWYIRCASLLWRAYNKPVGVGRLRTHYGGRKQRGARPEHHADAGGSMIRRGLQQLEKAGLVKKQKEGGRAVTGAGMKLLDSVAKEMSG